MIRVVGLNEKRFNAFAFVWGLFCFLFVHLYAQALSHAGLATHIFLLGLFASPIWLVYGWDYLQNGRPIGIGFLFASLPVFGFWLWVESESGNEQWWAPIACCMCFWILAVSCAANKKFLNPVRIFQIIGHCVSIVFQKCCGLVVEEAKEFVSFMRIAIPLLLLTVACVFLYHHFIR